MADRARLPDWPAAMADDMAARCGSPMHGKPVCVS